MSRPTGLVDALRLIREATDTGEFFRELGYRPELHRYGESGWIVARWRSFKIVAVDSTNPREDARLLASRLASSADRGLACAIAAAKEMALAAPRLGSSGSTRILLVSLREPSPFAVAQLDRLRPGTSGSALVHALRVSELLDSEAAGVRFFTAFRVMHERMAHSLRGNGTEADRRLAALLSLTRVLFLYFVQAKGWLDCQSDFLRHHLDRALGSRRHFHRTVLNPLFFGTLNCPMAKRSTRPDFGAVPYLNGGLFERHPVERRLGSVLFSNALWREAFDTLFERFRFCVREADEVNAIAPDMLGRVFERIMDGAERHDTGTFYTPESVVRQIVDAAIETALTGQGGLDEDAARRVVTGTLRGAAARKHASRLLRRLRILDPAVGSGAFLLGALAALTEMLVALEDSATVEMRLRVRREILRTNLVGVDLNPVAVRLAELRLWLAVVADDPTTDPTKVASLPNLDGVVRQGDTLFDPIGAARAFDPSLVITRSQSIRAVTSTRDAIFEARGPAQKAGLRKLRAAETDLARSILETARGRTEYQLRDLSAAAASRDLFGRRAGLPREQRTRYKTLKVRHRAIVQSLSALADGVLPFFSFEVHAPDVLVGGGFSVVIGNPPWVRAERLTATRRKSLRQRFSWWKSDTTVGFAHLPDLSIAFLERAFELTAPGGAVGFLLPSKVMSAGYGQVTRTHLVSEATITYLHRVSDQQAANFGATAYPLALVAKKSRPGTDHSVNLGFDRANSLRQSGLRVDGPWVLVPDRLREAIEEFRTAGTPLGEVVSPALGVKTGADDVLVGEKIEALDHTSLVRFGRELVELESALLRTAVRGRDVAPFSVTPKRVLLWAHDEDGQPLEKLPRLAKSYLNRNRRRLRSRSDYVRGPLWTVFRVRAAISKHRVVWSDISPKPRAVVLDYSTAGDAIPLNTCYVIAAPDGEAALVFAAVLNSSWAQALVLTTADEARGGYRRINARVVSQIPIPTSGEERRTIAALSARAHRKGNVAQADLDEAVAEALELQSTTKRSLRRLINTYR